MRIGAASRGLPVPPRTPLGGYADRTETASGTLDELLVCCVAIESASSALVLVVVDLVCVNTDLADAVSDAVAARVPGAHVWTLATHTHSGPDVNCGTGERATPARWVAAVRDAAAAAAQEAFGRRRPGSLELRSGPVHDVGAVRAAEEAPATVPADLLAVTAGGRLEGVLAVLPVHPTVLPASSSLVSGDLAAAVRRGLAEQLATAGHRPWVVVATGCAGDISTRATRRAQTPAEVARLGRLAAEQLAATLVGPALLAVSGEAPIRAAARRLWLPVRDDRPAAEAEPAPTGSPLAERIAHTREQGLAVARERSARFPSGVVQLAVSAAAVGELRLIGLGAEPYLRIRDRPDPPAVVLGYANGYAGYLPDADGFGRPTYESLSSPFRPDAATVAVRAAEDLLAPPELEEPT